MRPARTASDPHAISSAKAVATGGAMKGKLRGKKPKLSDRQQKELRRMYDTGGYAISDLAELFSISRPTIYRTLERQPATLPVVAA
jgi:DNA invertase Pin-like site-specific DNA recombinase